MSDCKCDIEIIFIPQLLLPDIVISWYFSCILISFVTSVFLILNCVEGVQKTYQ